jgi:hypothetical protein
MGEILQELRLIGDGAAPRSRALAAALNSTVCPYLSARPLMHRQILSNDLLIEIPPLDGLTSLNRL